MKFIDEEENEEDIMYFNNDKQKENKEN